MKLYLPVFKKISVLIIFTICAPGFISAQWSPKRKISTKTMSPQLNEDMGQDIEVSGDSLHVAWSDKRTHGSAIYYSHSYDTGITWTAGRALTDTAGKASFAAIAVSGRNIHIVWIDTVNRKPASFYIRSTDGGNTWGSSYCLDSNTIFWPGIAVSGSFVIVSLNKGVPDSTLVFTRRSLDNGNTWDIERQVSTRPPAKGRSEDPAINTDGKNVHLSWNDNRNGTMLIHYRRSTNMGVTWGKDSALTNIHSYTSMVCLNGQNTDVPYGLSTGTFEVWLRQSSDSGSVFSAEQQLTSSAAGDGYPYLVRDGMNLHMVYFQFGAGSGPWYIHSGDGGATWSNPYSFGPGGQSFIAYTYCTLHVIFVDSNAVYYTRNPTGNGICLPSGIPANPADNSKITLLACPGIFSNTTTIEYSIAENSFVNIKIYDITGREVATLMKGERNAGEMNKLLFDASNLSPGMYLCRLVAGNSVVTQKLIVTKN